MARLLVRILGPQRRSGGTSCRPCSSRPAIAAEVPWRGRDLELRGGVTVRIAAPARCAVGGSRGAQHVEVEPVASGDPEAMRSRPATAPRAPRAEQARAEEAHRVSAWASRVWRCRPSPSSWRFGAGDQVADFYAQKELKRWPARPMLAACCKETTMELDEQARARLSSTRGRRWRPRSRQGGAQPDRAARGREGPRVLRRARRARTARKWAQARSPSGSRGVVALAWQAPGAGASARERRRRLRMRKVCSPRDGRTCLRAARGRATV